MLFNNRYYVRRLLGQGSFGRVLEVIDNKEKTIKAIKIVKPGTYMREAKQEEKLIR
jgi:serine/threonine protein kinase